LETARERGKHQGEKEKKKKDERKPFLSDRNADVG